MWFGWLPILSDSLMPKRAVAELTDSSVGTDVDRTFVSAPVGEDVKRADKDKKRAFPQKVLEYIRSTLGAAAGDSVFCYLRDFDDTGRNPPRRVAIAMDADAFVTKVGIFGNDGHECEVLAEIQELETNGKLGFRLTGGKYAAQDWPYPDQVFGVVRDVYHEHVYAASTDFALYPAKAKNWSEAAQHILGQYRQKIIDYHRAARLSLSKAETSLFHRRGDAFDQAELIASGQGEMLYAQAFVRHFGLGDDALEGMKRAQRSLGVLAEQAQSVSAARTAAHGVGSGIRMTLLTSVLAVVAGWQVWATYEEPSPEAPYGMLAVAVVVAYLATGALVTGLGWLCQAGGQLRSWVARKLGKGDSGSH